MEDLLKAIAAAEADLSVYDKDFGKRPTPRPTKDSTVGTFGTSGRSKC
jgi:hypothetical protein